MSIAENVAAEPVEAESSRAENGLIEEDSLIEDDSLIEEVSIDGMCGVY